MPYTVRKGTGKRKWKIINKKTRRIVGSSLTKREALKSIVARNIHEKR